MPLVNRRGIVWGAKTKPPVLANFPGGFAVNAQKHRNASNYTSSSQGTVLFGFRHWRDPMTSPSSWYGLARECQMRAAEARARADELKEIEPKAIMLRIAADYDRVA